MSGEDRALLIYDGACAFCCVWAKHWRAQTGERVHYATSQEISVKFPDVSRERYARAVQLIDEDGSRHEGAAAVFRLLSKRPGWGWFWKLYGVPAVALVSEWAYHLVARHRPFFFKLTRALWGEEVATPRYDHPARLFLRVLAVIYGLAFVSLCLQLPGLIGDYGILPASSYLHVLRAQHGAAAFWIAPSLAWLIGAHTGALQLLALCGALAAVIAFGGFLRKPFFVCMWLAYLSLVSVGQEFLSLPGDALLLESGFLALFLARARPGTASRFDIVASPLVVWLYRFLLFRLVFSAGISRLLSHGNFWRDPAALSVHLETQFSPTVLAWFAHQAPSLLLQCADVAMLTIELCLPFLFFLPKRARRLAAIMIAVGQLLSILVGEGGLLPWLTLALCFFLLDDDFFKRFFPHAVSAPGPFSASASPLRRRGALIAAALLLILGSTQLLSLLVRPPLPLFALSALAAPFRLSNAYGSSKLEAASRAEIVLEGSPDGVLWKEYAFKQKPGDRKRPPDWFNIFPARLDARLIQAAREGEEVQPWVSALLTRLLQGSKPVLALFKNNPFPDAPPLYMRATVYAYRFTTQEERARDGSWWRREMRAPYLPTMSLGLQSPRLP